MPRKEVAAGRSRNWHGRGRNWALCQTENEDHPVGLLFVAKMASHGSILCVTIDREREYGHWAVPELDMIHL